MGIAYPTPTKRDLADWFSGLAIHLSTMYKKEEQEEMSDLGFEFDPSKVPEDEGGSFDPVPKGTYNVVVEKTEVKDTKNADGRYLNLQLKIEGPSHVNRVLFDRVALSTTSTEPGKLEWVKIGQRKLAALCRATGLSSVKDSGAFVGKRAAADVKIKPAKGEHDASNEVNTYKPAQAMPAQSESAPAPAANKAPWQ